MNTSEKTMEKIQAHCKDCGFIFRGSCVRGFPSSVSCFPVFLFSGFLFSVIPSAVSPARQAKVSSFRVFLSSYMSASARSKTASNPLSFSGSAVAMPHAMLKPL